LLNGGEVAAIGPVGEVVDRYMSMVMDQSSAMYECAEEREGPAWIASARMLDRNLNPAQSFLMTEPITVEVAIEVVKPLTYSLSIQVKEMSNAPVYHFHSSDAQFEIPHKTGRQVVRIKLPGLNLINGHYQLQLNLSHTAGSGYDVLHTVDGLVMTIEHDPAMTTRQLGRHCGVVYANADWSVD